MPSQLDMFSHDSVHSRVTTRAKGQSRPQNSAMTEQDMQRSLEATGRYRILTKLQPRAVAPTPRPGFPLRGVILDTETTGLNARTDEIIEIGVLAFTFNADGGIGDVSGLFGGMRQPSGKIPAEITRLTGITDEMVAGKSIDIQALERLIAPADLLIAHNAAFDRPFCEAFSPMFVNKAWACSVAEIDWRARGYEGTKLGYLIGQSGYFHDGHRAVDDCFALLEVLSGGGQKPGRSAFAELYAASQQSRVRIYAEQSPFDMKDQLKARGYRWSDGSEGRPKSWWIELPEDALDDELLYLRSEIYRWQDADPPVVHLTAFDRFRTRK
ncbi:3'-5' exonuclease [Rhizobium sp. KVB221]|uniref:3'-5' exonuclease n=1 Tax=Rhizobium setariae TaxID=2801340 RepID=A0A937CQC5_9HYPH|nr:3'-5' exonuclease [Rhizobium setariae]MBL0373703.1 3'-5' exonuclease [Rhizobium setariae]